ncbi:endonuclease domain-containing protein [Cryptosporangium sp. NPDC048952]|uniref:endonuclease domain-containing protein n=1 Tax=Cryptosporangium sp. NPDC048952 TaxID=3363961 RepID=UPI00371E1C50
MLEASAVSLFPAWLPEAAGITDPTETNVAAVRALASRLAGKSRHFGPFLADLAVRALTGVGSSATFQPEIRAAGLTRVLLAAYSRADVVLAVDVPEDMPPSHETPLIAALEWLAFRGGFGGVWLTGSPLSDVDRVQTQRVRLPTAVGGPLPPTDEVLAIPSLGGQPNPNSAAEKLLEKVLSSRAWARGRAWNRPFSFGPLTNEIRIDLLWEAERIAVEVDGPEHRGPLHYATDRTRDVLLQTAGYAVLRFTNDQVLDDVNAVVQQLELFLDKRRVVGRGKGSSHAD